MAMKTGRIKQSRYVAAKPETVYEAFVNAKKHTAFTGGEATGAARTGAAFTAWDGYISGKHVVLEKGKRIVQEWSTAEWPEGAPPSRLEFTFEPKGDGCQVTMLQTLVPADQVEKYKKGWIDFYWTPLANYFKPD